MGRAIERRAAVADRRRNTVVLTDRGHRTLIEGARAVDRAERHFLAPLSGSDADRLRRMLQAIVDGDGA